MGQHRARKALLEHLGLEDNVPEVFRASVELCHVCENSSSSEKVCGNPAHTYWGSTRENRADTGKTPTARLSKALPTYCGEAGPVPKTELDLGGLVKRYGKTRSVVFRRRDLLVKHRLVAPERAGKTVWYSPEDVRQFDRLDYWLRQGYTYEECDKHLDRQHTEENVNCATQPDLGVLVELVADLNRKLETLVSSYTVS